jgi:hypothetical protein
LPGLPLIRFLGSLHPAPFLSMLPRGLGVPAPPEESLHIRHVARFFRCGHACNLNIVVLLVQVSCQIEAHRLGLHGQDRTNSSGVVIFSKAD